MTETKAGAETKPYPEHCGIREHLGACEALGAWKRCGDCPNTTFEKLDDAQMFLWANGFRLAPGCKNIWANCIDDQGYVEPVVDEKNAVIGWKSVIERVPRG